MVLRHPLHPPKITSRSASQTARIVFQPPFFRSVAIAGCFSKSIMTFQLEVSGCQSPHSLSQPKNNTGFKNHAFVADRKCSANCQLPPFSQAEIAALQPELSCCAWRRMHIYPVIWKILGLFSSPISREIDHPCLLSSPNITA